MVTTPYDDPALAAGPKRPATADRAMVASSHPAVTVAALDALRAGGTAVDAMVTAVLLQQVVEPQLSTLAGGFGMLHRDASTTRATYLNAGPDHSSGGTIAGRDLPDTAGEHVAAPGTVVGLRAAVDRFGTQPWEAHSGPAIAAAEDGFTVYDQLHRALLAAEARITQHPSGRARYAPDGRVPDIGRLFRQPALAATLRRLAAPDGVDWFQRGPFADRFAAAVRGTGGTLTRADMARYEPRWSTPLSYRYRDHHVLGPPPPDTGGLYCAFALGVLEQAGIGALGPWPTSPCALAIIALAQDAAQTHVERYGADPLAREVPVDVLLSPEYLRLTARLLSGSGPQRPTAAGPAPVGSNQLVIVDGAGNWVCMLHTGYGTDFGTGLVVDGVGTNAAGLFPGTGTGHGRRILAPLSSTLVLRGGRPWIGLGTPGHPAPYTALLLLDILEYGMSVPEAVDAPRFAFDLDAHGPLAVEARIPQPTVDGLAESGITTRLLTDHDRATGRFQAVVRGDDDRLVGVVDPRGSGVAAGHS